MTERSIVSDLELAIATLRDLQLDIAADAAQLELELARSAVDDDDDLDRAHAAIERARAIVGEALGSEEDE